MIETVLWPQIIHFMNFNQIASFVQNLNENPVSSVPSIVVFAYCIYSFNWLYNNKERNDFDC